MLNVPDAIKALYKTDGIWKNVLARFPNGDYGDIRNDRIVRESLKLTESACSEEVFRFGGCERSVIEFETVGVDNIRGKIMDCYIEIDCSSLSAEDVASIQADPGDGEYLSASESGVSRAVYRIPLGRFRVVKCPRDHSQQTHRQITAYSPKYWRMSPIESAKLDGFSGNKSMSIDPERFFLANVGYYAPGFMESMGFEKVNVTDWSAFSSATTFNTSGIYYNADGEERHFNVIGKYRTLQFTQAAGIGFQTNHWLGIDMGDFDAAGLDEFIRGWMVDTDWKASDMSYGPVDIRGADDFIRYVLGADCHAAPFMQRYDLAPFGLQVTAISGDVEVWDATGMPPDYDGRMIPNTLVAGAWTLSIPENVTIELLDEYDDLIVDFTTGVGENPPSIFGWSKTGTDSRSKVNLTPPVTNTLTWTDTSGNTTTWRSWQGIDAEKIIKGWMEVNGCLLTAGRGVPRVVQLTQDADESWQPGDMESAWWDEDLTDQIGNVIFYYGSDHDLVGKWNRGYGKSIYDLTDNGMLEVCFESSKNIRNMLADRMADGLMSLGLYYPAEITKACWPWMEPGDALLIQAQDETEAETYLMTRTISGIQMLSDEITAPGGDVEDEE